MNIVKTVQTSISFLRASIRDMENEILALELDLDRAKEKEKEDDSNIRGTE